MEPNTPFYEYLDPEYGIREQIYEMIREIDKLADNTRDAATLFFAQCRLDNTTKVHGWFNKWDHINETIAEDPELAKFKYLKIRALLRDLWYYICDNWRTDLPLTISDDIIYQYMDYYLEFKRSVNEVSPEISDEVDRLAAMSKEEFEAEMAAEDDEAEEEDSDEEDEPEDDDGGNEPDEEANEASDGAETETEPTAPVEVGNPKPVTSGIPISIINPKQ